MRYLYIFSIVLLFTCCTHNSKKTNLTHNSNSNYEQDLLRSPDNSFIEFFENFMWDKEFQKTRVIFPITIDEDMIITNKNNWKYI